MRRSILLWFLVATCVGVALFLVKHEVQRREDQLAALHREILASQEAIHVLEAEWSYLNRPDRLEALVRRHLDLVPLETHRLGALDALPMRLPPVPVPVPEAEEPPQTVAADNGTDAGPGAGTDVDAAFKAAVDSLTAPPLPVRRPVVLTGGRKP